MDLPAASQEQIKEKLQRYFSAELDRDLGQFEAGFLLEFLEKELGPHFYNQGLMDAKVVIATKVEEIENAIYEIEKPVGR